MVTWTPSLLPVPAEAISYSPRWRPEHPDHLYDYIRNVLRGVLQKGRPKNLRWVYRQIEDALRIVEGDVVDSPADGPYHLDGTAYCLEQGDEEACVHVIFLIDDKHRIRGCYIDVDGLRRDGLRCEEDYVIPYTREEAEYWEKKVYEALEKSTARMLMKIYRRKLAEIMKKLEKTA